MAIERLRLKFTFWLDVNKDDEYKLVEQIDELKQKRLFSQTIRDGIRLICDLKDGNTDVLFELFPWLAAELVAAQADTSGQLQQELSELKDLILTQNGTHFSRIELDEDDEDDIELEVSQVSDSSSAQNFLSSILNLQE